MKYLAMEEKWYTAYCLLLLKEDNLGTLNLNAPTCSKWETMGQGQVVNLGNRPNQITQ